MSWKEQLEQRVQAFDQEIITVLKQHGPLTRGELVSKLNRPRTTIYDHLDNMRKRNVIKSFIRPKSSRGRPPVFYKLVE